MDEQLRRNPQFQSYIAVSLGFDYVGKALEPYTRAGLQTVHQEGYKQFGGLPTCTKRCSDQHKRDISKWCNTCNTWGNYLLQKHRGVRARWGNTESWRWADEYESIADVFLPPNWSGSKTKLDDVATACYVWSNCKEFNLGEKLISKLRTLRNNYVGHNPGMKVTESDKIMIFNELKTFISSNHVKVHINLKKCKRELDNMAKATDEMTAFMNRIDDRIDRLLKEVNTIDSAQSTLAVCINDLVTEPNPSNRDNFARRNDKEIKPRRQSFKAPSWKLTSAVFIVTMMVVISLVKYPQYEDCLSEMYSYPFPQDMPLMPYLKEHDSLIGRQWLFDEISTMIFQQNSQMKGVLLTADMGYGKSSIVKHLLCSKKDEKGHGITERIVAFHICKFDVPSTRNTGRFVHRLIGFLATNIPEFGGIISMLPDSALFYDRDKCRKEIVACFDQGILHPLNELKGKVVFPLIIIIDALDECLNDRTADNELFDLLLTRYRKMPKWLKFVVTSRNITLVHDFHSMDKLHLTALDKRNLADINTYFDYKISVSSSIVKSNGDFDTVIDQSEGNFLFAVHLINYIFINQDAAEHSFPKTLREVYEINFERHFSLDINFKIAKIILELVLASLQPLSMNDVEAILNDTNSAAVNLFPDIFEKLSFCFRSVEELTIIHQSLYLWLISEENIRFGISIENGHALLSEYLLGQVDRNRTHDIVDIVIHVTNAKRSVLKNAFASLNDSANIPKSSIHRLIWKTDSKHALELLLKLNVTVDELNEGNVTPAFVAAARGHLDQLKYLELQGADLNFIVNSAYLITSPEHINLIKHEYYFGYGLIHIAAQFGHVNIVEYLINQNKSISHNKNGLRMTVVEMACENGHLAILEFVNKHDSNFGHCVYYAAKNRRLHILRYLVEVGVNTSCISRKQSNNAFENITTVDTSKFIIQFGSTVSYPHYEVYDLWWIVQQESALHAAIRAKFSETTEFLIRHYPHLADCVDASGMTPFLLSVAINDTDTSEILIDRISSDKCSEASYITQKDGNAKSMPCPVGASFPHLVAIYRRLQLTYVLRRRGIRINWLIPDANNITTLHYAACSGNINFIYYTKLALNISFSDIRSINGSTPFHSAAICGSLVSIMAMATGSSIPDLKDISNKTILHYLVLRKFYGNPAKNDFIQQEKCVAFLNYIVHNSTIILNATDSDERNVIHYALRNGHYLIIDYFFIYNIDLLATMVEQTDINGKTPVRYAVDILKSDFNNDVNILVPYNCSLYDIFYELCGTWRNLENYLTSLEISLSRVMFLLTSNWHRHFLPIIHDLVKTSPYLTTAVLTILKRPALGTIRSQFIQSIKESPSQYSVYSIARHRPKLFSICGKSINQSPLNLPAYRTKNMQALHDIHFYNLAFGNPIDTKALSCVDSVGYNSFHYALLGDNIRMATLLFDLGVQITSIKVEIQDIPWMILLGKKQSIKCQRCNCSDQISCMDDLLFKIFTKFGDKFKVSEICDENRHRLSLVHVVGASGLRRSLKILGDIFGLSVIKCKNRDGISPLYLGALMNHGFNGTLETLKPNTPRSVTETLLLLFLYYDYPFLNDCILSTIRYNSLSAHKCDVWIERYRYNTNFVLHTLLPMFHHEYVFNEQFRNVLITKNLIELEKLVHEVLCKVCNRNDTLKEFGKDYKYRYLSYLRTLPGTCLALNKAKKLFFKIYIELEHMVRKFISVQKSRRVQLLLDNMNNIGATNRINLPFFKTCIERQSGLDIFQLQGSKSIEELVLEHNYLDMLRKTKIYQYLKKVLFWNCQTNPIYTTTIPVLKDPDKPFDHLIKFSKISSYTP